MKITVIVQIDSDMNHMFEGEASDVFRRDVLNTINATIPQLSLKFGDSGSTVLVPLSKVKQ